jgi:hypothetical protein
MIINIKKSRNLRRIVGALHVGALMAALSLPVGAGIRLGLATIVVGSMEWQRRFGWQGVPALLELRADGTCSIRGLHARQTFEADIVGVDIHPGFVRLTVKTAGRRSRVLLVMRDAVEPHVYRELRARIVQRRLLRRDQAAT